MIKPVRLFTDKILHQKCNLVTDFSNMESVGQDLIESCFAYRGVGLAAPQIGLDIQACALFLESKTKQIIICNPKILNQSTDLSVEQEGCLSAPGMTVRVQRPIWVEFEYQKLNGEKDTMKLEGYDARIFFHEYMHLLGRTIVDHLMGMGL